MKLKIQKANLPFIGVEYFYWAGLAFYYPFFVPFLKASGFDELQIGVIASVMSFIGIVGPVLWGAVSDRVRNTKAILAGNLIAGCIAMQFIPSTVQNLTLLFAVLIAVNMTVFPQGNVLDGWLMRKISRGAPINYGLVRGIGSLAYAVTSMAAGLLLTWLGLAAMFPMVFSLIAVASVFILLVKNTPESETPATEQAGAEEPAKPIYKNAPYILFVGIATFLFIGATAALNFYWILLEKAGGTPADLGLANCLMALGEFPVMFLTQRLLRRFKDTSLLLFAMVFYILRLFLFYILHSSVTGLVLAQLTNSLSFGLFLPVSVHYISRITPHRTKATALSVASSMYMGASGILGNLLGGIAIDAWGVRAMVGLAGIVVTLAAAAFGVALILVKKRT